jgi:hypothetical protein
MDYRIPFTLLVGRLTAMIKEFILHIAIKSHKLPAVLVMLREQKKHEYL